MGFKDGVSESGLDIMYRDPSWDNLGSGPNAGRPRLIPVLRAKDNNQPLLATSNGCEKSVPSLASDSKRNLLARKHSNTHIRMSEQSKQEATCQGRPKGFQSLGTRGKPTVKNQADPVTIAASGIGLGTKSRLEPPKRGRLTTGKKCAIPKAGKSAVELKTNLQKETSRDGSVAQRVSTNTNGSRKSGLSTIDTSATKSSRLSTSHHRNGASSLPARHLSNINAPSINAKDNTLTKGGSAIGERDQGKNEESNGNCKRFPTNAGSTTLRRQKRLASDKRRVAISHVKEERSTTPGLRSRHTRQSVIELQEQKKLVSSSTFLLNDCSLDGFESRLKEWTFGETPTCSSTPMQHQKSNSLSKESTVETEHLQHQATVKSCRLLSHDQILKEELNEQEPPPRVVTPQYKNLAAAPPALKSGAIAQTATFNRSEVEKLVIKCDKEIVKKEKHAPKMDTGLQNLRQEEVLGNFPNANQSANLYQQLGKMLETGRAVAPNSGLSLAQENTSTTAAENDQFSCSHESVIDMLTKQLPLFISAVDQLRSMIVDCSLNDLETSPGAKYTPVLAMVDTRKIHDLTSEDVASSSLRLHSINDKQIQGAGAVINTTNKLSLPGDMTLISDVVQSAATSDIATEARIDNPEMANHDQIGPQVRVHTTSCVPDTSHGHGQLQKSESIEDALRFILTNSNGHNVQYNTRTSSLAARQEDSSQLHVMHKLPMPPAPPCRLRWRPLLQESRRAVSGLQSGAIGSCPEAVGLYSETQRAPCNLITDDCLSMASTDAPPQYSVHNPKVGKVHTRPRSSSIASKLTKTSLPRQNHPASWKGNNNIGGHQLRLKSPATSTFDHGHSNKENLTGVTSVRKRLASKIRIQSNRQRPKAAGKALS